MLKPLNTASQCLNPDADCGAASVCYGAEVDEDGKYSCRFDSDDIDTQNLVFVANESDYIKSGEKGASKDIYVLSESKRRVDNVEKDTENKTAGIEKIRIDLVGPSGQILTAWGVFSNTYPTFTTATVETAVLSDLTESGSWHR